MKIFQYNDELKSYKYPVIKLLICIVLIVAFIYRDHIIPIDNKVIDNIVGVCCQLIGVQCIYCVYISIAEILQVRSNKKAAFKQSKRTAADGKAYSIDKIVKMTEVNDIIEIMIIANNEQILIGSSSDCKEGSSRFFDKQYFIGKEIFQSILAFKTALQQYTLDGKLFVVLIDGVKPQYYRIG